MAAHVELREPQTTTLGRDSQTKVIEQQVETLDILANLATITPNNRNNMTTLTETKNLLMKNLVTILDTIANLASQLATQSHNTT